MLAQFRAEAARERDELRADLRARAERAEREADTFRDEFARARDAAIQDSETSTAMARQRAHSPAR